MEKQNTPDIDKLVTSTLQVINSNEVDKETKELAKKSLKSGYFVLSEIMDLLELAVKEALTDDTKESLRIVVKQFAKELNSTEGILGILSMLKK